MCICISRLNPARHIDINIVYSSQLFCGRCLCSFLRNRLFFFLKKIQLILASQKPEIVSFPWITTFYMKACKFMEYLKLAQ